MFRIGMMAGYGIGVTSAATLTLIIATLPGLVNLDWIGVGVGLLLTGTGITSYGFYRYAKEEREND